MLFRSYDSLNSAHEDCMIWQAACATTATPGLMEPIIIGRGQWYIDGGMGCNNPIRLVLSEAKDMFPARRVAGIISVGAGHPQTIALLSSSIGKTLSQMAEDSEGTHDDMVQRFSQYSELYHRFNVDQGAQVSNLGPAAVEAHSLAYLGRHETKTRIAEAAGIIVRRRGVIEVGDLSMKTCSPLRGLTNFCYRFNPWQETSPYT